MLRLLRENYWHTAYHWSLNYASHHRSQIWLCGFLGGQNKYPTWYSISWLLKQRLPGLSRILPDRLAKRYFTLYHVRPIYFSFLWFHISQ